MLRRALESVRARRNKSAQSAQSVPSRGAGKVPEKISELARQLVPKHGFMLRHFSGPNAYHPSLEHVRVAHITDMHFGRVTPEAVQREAVRLVNASNADLCVISGDFVCYSQKYFDQMQAVLSELRMPTFGVLGNHDYWSGSAEVAQVLKKTSVELLRNQHTEITVRGQRLQIVGLDDSYTSHGDLERATRGLNTNVPSLAITHVPEDADRIWQHGIPMVFAGHTHAGQVTLASLNELAIGKIAGHKYIHGLYGDRGAHGALYVGAGVGAGVMPVRVGTRGKREVTVFELGQHARVDVEPHQEQQPRAGRKPSELLKKKRIAYVEKRMLARELKKAKAELKAVGGRLSRLPPPRANPDDSSDE